MKTKDTDYSLRLEYTNKKGRREKIYNAISYNPYTQILSGNRKFETLDDSGAVIEERFCPLKTGLRVHSTEDFEYDNKKQAVGQHHK